MHACISSKNWLSAKLVLHVRHGKFFMNQFSSRLKPGFLTKINFFSSMLKGEMMALASMNRSISTFLPLNSSLSHTLLLTRILCLAFQIKCTQYWPKEGEAQFGEITIRLLTTIVFAEYTIRRFRFSKVVMHMDRQKR